MIGGDMKYTFTWSLVFNKEKTPYLNTEAFCSENPSGGCRLPLTKVGAKDYNIFLGDVLGSDGKQYMWHIEKIPFFRNVGVDRKKIIKLELDPEFTHTLDRYISDYPLEVSLEIQSVQSDLDGALRHEEFEKAAELRDRIQALEEKLKS